LQGGAALSVLLKRESQGDFAADYCFDAIVSKISASTTVGVPSLSAQRGSVSATPEMPIVESEQGSRPIQSRVERSGRHCRITPVQQHDVDVTGGQFSGIAPAPAGAADWRLDRSRRDGACGRRGVAAVDVTGGREFGN